MAKRKMKAEHGDLDNSPDNLPAPEGEPPPVAAFGADVEPPPAAVFGTDSTAARILESISDAFFALDKEWRFIYVNDQMERDSSQKREELLGRSFWAQFPAAVGTLFEREYRRAVDEQVSVTFEAFYPPLNLWVDVRAFPSAEGLSVFFQDITAQKQREEALKQSEERYRLLVEGAKDYAMILMDAHGRITGWNTGAERIMGWTEGEVLGRTADLIFTPEDRAGGVPGQDLAKAAAQGKAMNLRWHLKKDGSRFFADGIMECLRDAAGGLRGFGKVLRDATERRVSEEEQARLSQANRLLLDSTGDGIYGIDTEGRFTFVNRAAAQMLGYAQEQMLGQNGHRLIHFQHTDGRPYPQAECPIFQAMHTGEPVRVEDEVYWRQDGTAFPIAYSAAPIVEEGIVRGAVVTFFDVSERKALEQERQRLAERERNIATQLQAALTPIVPAHIPGMVLSKHYEAALTEAAVGGDFYDVFPIEKGCTALVVGDLAGKGLAAAAQVATVRNMLRYGLYRARTLVGALEGLNALLVEQGLLSGFATLFVGAYESGLGTLTYVNAGQEPALVRRAATGQVESLSPTGPVVGIDENAVFTEVTIRLAPGDALAIFTDGLTEVGPSRREMLGVEGVAALMAQSSEEGENAAEQAETVVLWLVAGVDAASRGGVARDDMCVLVGVVVGRDA